MDKNTESSCNNDQHQTFLMHLSRNYNRIRGFIQLMLANPGDVDDVMQETTLVLWQKFDRYDQKLSFSAWGIGIARHRILKLYEKQNRDKALFQPEVLFAIAQHEKVFTERFDDRIQALNACIEKLNDKDRKILNLRYHQSLSIKSMAEELQRPAHGLYRTLSRISTALMHCVRRRMAVQNL